ncbi:hypothetical protein WELLINGTON_146 [Erwinia phage Wellington]|uniref:Uncharacterized protein n=1 Tax=Erwinia phage Wellington TaxID=2267653 RepID=A0A345BLF4_9CAUD|nr:hypothetical protein HOT70_gp155 [Erwinia phage Wellington]AXF51275.1 hypothetical protein WELLINGTON_146 [Erwinia phage Wellington]
MPTYIALTGGLDSTWCLVNGKKAGNSLEPVVFNMGNGINAVIIEYLLGREMVRRLWKDKKGDVMPHHAWGKQKLGGYIFTNNNTPTMRMIQQGRVVNGLARVACDDSRIRDPIHCIVGWHRDDAFENNGEYGDWSLDDYSKLKQLFELQCYFADTGRRIQPLATPAWDKPKIDMWSELPDDLRPLVTVHWHNALSIVYSDKRKELLICAQPTYFSHKVNEYIALGIDPTAAWIIKADNNLLRELAAPLFKEDVLPLAVKHMLNEVPAGAIANMEKVHISDNITINQTYPHTRWSVEGESILREFKEDMEAAYDAALQKEKATTAQADA